MLALTPQQIIHELGAKGLTQSEISRRTDIPPAILSTVHTGKRQWIRYVYMDKLRELLTEMRQSNVIALNGKRSKRRSS